MNQNLTALIVDDSASMRMVLTTALRDAGIEVIEATNGEQALEQAKNHSVDFVITDISMPGMDGIELITELRQLANYQFTPILTLTNLNSDGIRQKLKDIGATGWMQKPFGAESLIKTVTKLAA